MIIIQTPVAVSLRACGLQYLWERDHLTIFAGGVIISRQPLDRWDAIVRMEAARDAHFNFLESLP